MKALRIAAAALVGAALAAVLPANAQDNYPNSPVKLIVPFAPGGSSDVSARIFARFAEQELGTSIAVVNTAGAAGSIGTREAAKSEADGYTLLWHIPTIMTSYHTGIQNFTWDALTPIGNVARFFKVVAVHSDSPWHSVNELLKDAKARPGEILWGVNIGAGLHFEALGLEDATGTSFRHVAGGGDADQAKKLLGKQIDVSTLSDTVAVQHFESGTLRPLGALTDERLESLPDVPTLKEQGIDYTFWYDIVLYGPPELPQELVTTWNGIIEKVANNPEAIEEFRKLGMVTAWLDPQETRAQLLDTDVDLYRFARRGGLRPDTID